MSNEVVHEYVNEKLNLALSAVKQALSSLQHAHELIGSISSSGVDADRSAQVHDALVDAEREITTTRRDFEKACWASAGKPVEFDDWLRSRNLPHLVWKDK